ncbi:hypothetical protein TRICHSKD4_1398 [Roseibium sp. TrichSKD4]|uniref:hypothetical protein n=1 Tax=Roseibium sp. TrichSKD4 TaxID=744980 RepID=UPI0001E56696|nr:hypothetical protein [Roseibium sp. TrichSKD4]EFO32781.1 hypothetical protein TRICHSKD4_1398 [Roseibium sp. TrichSKD4]
MSFAQTCSSNRSAIAAATVLVVVLFLAACGHVPIASIPKLAKLDLFETDPAALRVAVLYPDSIRIPEDGAKLELSVRDAATQTNLMEETIYLVKGGTSAEKAELASKLTSGKRLEVYQFSKADIAYMRAFQQRVKTLKETKGDTTEGSLSVSVRGCEVKPISKGPVRVSTFIKTVELDGFVTLLRYFDISEAVARQKADHPSMSDC